MCIVGLGKGNFLRPSCDEKKYTWPLLWQRKFDESYNGRDFKDTLNGFSLLRNVQPQLHSKTLMKIKTTSNKSKNNEFQKLKILHKPKKPIFKTRKNEPNWNRKKKEFEI